MGNDGHCDKLRLIIRFKLFLNMQESDTSMFYQKETMGTTIMAVRYQGGVIACADSRKCPLI